jgi:hypothetical protein
MGAVQAVLEAQRDPETAQTAVEEKYGPNVAARMVSVHADGLTFAPATPLS